MSKDIEVVRNELIDLIEEAGNDYKAADLLNQLLDGFGPDRSNLLRMRQGQGKSTMIAMTTKLLKRGGQNKFNFEKFRLNHQHDTKFGL